MTILVGTSGWTYDSWAGPFYPKGVARRRWLEFYAERLPTVELNASHYRWPTGHRVHRVARPAAGRVRDGGQGAACPDPRQAARRTRALERDHRAGDAAARRPRRAAPAPAAADHGARRRPARRRPRRSCRRGVRTAVEFRHPSWLDETRVRHPRAAPLRLRRDERRAPAVRAAGHERRGLRALARAERRAPLRRLLLRRRPALVGRPAARVGGAGHRVYGYFNNDQFGYAVANAMRLRELLGR